MQVWFRFRVSDQEVQRIRVVDSHTGGEPTRMVVSGFPDLGNGTMAERRERFRAEFDHYRTGILLEPRGSEVIVGALLVEPHSPNCEVGVIFFNNSGYLGMCGHGLIGVVESLAFLGRIGTGSHRIDTPVGVVVAEVASGAVSFDNVPSKRLAKDVSVDVPGIGAIIGDIAYGGNWFFLTQQSPFPLVPANVEALSGYTLRIREGLAAAGVTGENGAEIDHVELIGPSAAADSRNFVMCPGGQYDRSPCGTGTSAKLACLYEDGALAEDRWWRQEGILGSVFEGRVRVENEQIIPTIRSNAHVTADSTLIFDPSDPYRWGIRDLE